MLFSLLKEEPCQCADCQRFYEEHDRLIREFPTFKHQKELNWASIQSFRTLCSKVTEELQNQLSEKNIVLKTTEDDKSISEVEMKDLIDELENVNAYLYSIEALMERIFEIKVSDNVEKKFIEVAHELAPDPLKIDRIILNRLFHQTPDLPGKNNLK